jgi:hypothetical protein
MALRSRINECFELAALPHTTVEQRQKLLTFCVVRGDRKIAPSSRIASVEVFGPVAVLYCVPKPPPAGRRRANRRGSGSRDTRPDRGRPAELVPRVQGEDWLQSDCRASRCGRITR